MKCRQRDGGQSDPQSDLPVDPCTSGHRDDPPSGCGDRAGNCHYDDPCITLHGSEICRLASRGPWIPVCEFVLFIAERFD
jgi:hypothetical protein